MGLLDDDEEDAAATRRQDDDQRQDFEDEDVPAKGTAPPRKGDESATSIPTPPADVDQDEESKSADEEPVDSTMRLFVRNLPYDVKRADLETEFAPFGNIEEVSDIFSSCTSTSQHFQDEHLIGTTYAIRS